MQNELIDFLKFYNYGSHRVDRQWVGAGHSINFFRKAKFILSVGIGTVLTGFFIKPDIFLEMWHSVYIMGLLLGWCSYCYSFWQKQSSNMGLASKYRAGAELYEMDNAKNNIKVHGKYKGDGKDDGQNLWADILSKALSHREDEIRRVAAAYIGLMDKCRAKKDVDGFIKNMDELVYFLIDKLGVDLKVLYEKQYLASEADWAARKAKIGNIDMYSAGAIKEQKLESEIEQKIEINTEYKDEYKAEHKVEDRAGEIVNKSDTVTAKKLYLYSK